MRERAVGADGRGPAALLVEQLRARRDIAVLDQRTEGDLGGAALALHRGERAFVERQFLLDPLERGVAVIAFALAADPFAPQPFGHRAGGAGAEERIEHHVAALGGGEQHAVEQAFGLLRRVDLVPALLQPLRPVADRQHPVAAHLQFVVERLHRAVVEVILGLLALRTPQQRLMRIGEARAAEIGHRVRLAPDDVVEDPEAQVLQDRADAVDVVIAADDPQPAIGLEHALGLGQPFAGEIVVDLETVELVPVIGHRIDVAAIGPVEIAPELEVVGRVGEDEVHAGVGKRAHGGHAIAGEDLPQRKQFLRSLRRFYSRFGATLRGLDDPHDMLPCPELSTG